ncbi:MAG: hypothetical protein AB1485_08905 [Candidatus Thermoplasmatota archaeon]
MAERKENYGIPAGIPSNYVGLLTAIYILIDTKQHTWVFVLCF